MTYSQSIPIARQLAEKQLEKGFDVEAFLILNLLNNQQDIIPESDVDEQISDIGRIFIDYYNEPCVEQLDRLLNAFTRTISEIYNSLPDANQKAFFKNKIKYLVDMIE